MHTAVHVRGVAWLAPLSDDVFRRGTFHVDAPAPPTGRFPADKLQLPPFATPNAPRFNPPRCKIQNPHVNHVNEMDHHSNVLGLEKIGEEPSSHFYFVRNDFRFLIIAAYLFPLVKMKTGRGGRS